MRKQFSLVAVFGGALGIAATALMTWPRFTSNGPQAMHSEQLPGDLIFAILLLVPFVASILAAFILPIQSRWSVLLCTSLLSLAWLGVSNLTDNFPRAPFPGPPQRSFLLSALPFIPAAIVMIVACGLSVRHGAITALPRQKVVVLSTLAFLVACVLFASLYILFLHQGSELWSRPLYGGEWVRAPDVTHPPFQSAGSGPQEFINAGVVQPAMAMASTVLLVLGVSAMVLLFKMAGQSRVTGEKPEVFL